MISFNSPRPYTEFLLWHLVLNIGSLKGIILDKMGVSSKRNFLTFTC